MCQVSSQECEYFSRSIGEGGWWALYAPPQAQKLKKSPGKIGLNESPSHLQQVTT